jgi:hypothetical protein
VRPWVRARIGFAGDAVAEGELRQVFQHPTLGEIAIPAPPARLCETPASIRGLARSIETAPAWAPRAVAGPRSGEGGQPLTGVRVLDLGTVIAGAHAGGVLANLGADVVKIEPTEGDPFRSDNGGFPRLQSRQARAGHGPQAAGRQDLLLRPRPPGRRRARQLPATAFARAWRSTTRTLKAINPRIISCSINAYGDKGPRVTLPGFDPLLQAEGGMMQAQGGDDEPILHTIPVNDVATSAIVSCAVIAALNARERTGEGRRSSPA